jgi:hypothetical protein
VTTRILTAALVGLLGATPASAWWHQCGHYHMHYKAHGPVTGGAVTPGVVTHGLVTQGLVTQGLVTTTPHLVTQGLVTQGLVGAPFATQGLVTQGLVGTQGLVTQGLTTQGLTTQGLMDAGGLIAALRQLGCGGSSGGTTVDTTALNASIQGLKTEITALRQTNEKIYAELKQIRKGDKSDPPAPKAGASKGGVNTDADATEFKGLRRNTGVADLTALRQEVEAREAKAVAPVADLTALRAEVEARQAKAAAQPTVTASR